MKKLLIIATLLIGFFLFQPTVNAQAECDACGYCVGRPTPGNWESCRSCVYPNASKNASSNQTLEIKKNTNTGRNEPITKAPGKTYTQLGCLDVGGNSFSDPSAPGGVLNFLLTKLIFPIVGTLSFISLVYGAFLLITAQGAPEQISRGKSYIVGAIVGLIFTLSAILIVNIIAGDLLRIPGFSTAGKIQIAARGSSTTSSTGVETFPKMEIYLDNKLLESYDVNADKSYVATVPTDLPPTSVVMIRFTNDYCPECKARQDASYANDPNRDRGDRNVFIKNWSVNGKACKAFNYKVRDSGNNISSNIPVNMFFAGDVTCTTY